MEWLVVGGLGLLVWYLAKKAPGVQPTTSLGPDMMVPGGGAASVPSPATSNGSPYIAASNQLRLQTTYQYATDDQKVFAATTPRAYWHGRDSVIQGGNYMTDAQSSLMTQDVPAIVQPALPGAGGNKI